MTSEKVAISLPEPLLRLIDLEARAQGLSRSEFIRRAVDELFRRKTEQEASERYVEGYVALPESDEEIRDALATATLALTQEHWE